MQSFWNEANFSANFSCLEIEGLVIERSGKSYLDLAENFGLILRRVKDTRRRRKKF